MKKAILFFLFLFTAGVSWAQSSFGFSNFTDAERLSLLQILEGRFDLNDAMHKVGGAIFNGSTDAERQLFGDTLQMINNGSFDCERAIVELLSYRLENPETDRPTEVQQGINELDSCIGWTQAALTNITGVTRLDNAVNRLNRALTHFGNFDRGLGYLNWQTVFYPKVQGPHGWYQTSGPTLMRADEYLHHLCSAAIQFYRTAAVWPSTNDQDMADILTACRDAGHHLVTAAMMDQDIMRDSERSIIILDSEGSNNIRPPSFFIVPRQAEHLLNPGGLTNGGALNHRGRPFLQGAANDYEGFSKVFARIVRRATLVNDITEIQRWWVGSGSGRGVPDGTAFQFFSDHPDSWKDLDRWGHQIDNFMVNTTFAPPPDNGGGQVCGPGTHDPGDGVCVPDDPTTCPVFVPSLVLLDGVTAQAQCLQIP